MIYLLLGGFALVASFVAYRSVKGVSQRGFRRSLRYLFGGAGVVAAIALAFARRFDLALFLGAGAITILRTGRLGPISLDGAEGEPGNVSKVRSQFFAMELDHDTGTVAGAVLAGRFKGHDLMDLGEHDTRMLLEEIAGDADSQSLLESWLDANRAGWREYFAAADSGDEQTVNSDPVAEAYEILGLKPGASDDEIRSAHRDLMKAVHPDHGGSSYLAAKINQARDRLLRR